jgi:DNA ligase-1
MTPVLPMLAQSAADAEAALAALGRAQLEWKLDGARVQVHRSGSEVRVFTRNQKEVTRAVPEVAAAARGARAARFILDGEASALRGDGRPQRFQETMRRFGRKLDDEALRRELPLSVFFFDCLFAGDAPLLERPLSQRRQALEAIVTNEQLTPCTQSAEAATAASFYAEALRQGHEGIMAKAIDSTYDAGRRSAAWLKVKRAHTLDLVVLAAEWGHGRRRGWLSNLHLGAREPRSASFVMLGKTFKGLTDEILQWQTRELLAREVSRDEWTVHVRPELVVEIAFNDIQASPQYSARLALRFARVNAYRPDKRPEEADTVETVRLIFEGQQAGG